MFFFYFHGNRSHPSHHWVYALSATVINAAAVITYFRIYRGLGDLIARGSSDTLKLARPLAAEYKIGRNTLHQYLMEFNRLNNFL